MRDKKFIAEHRGGLLTGEQHFQLMKWACACAGHVMPLWGDYPDKRLLIALETGIRWTQGKSGVGEAREASVEVHRIARELSDPVKFMVARAVGHAVATAHMADHSEGAAVYGLKAVKLAGGSVEEERRWQKQQLAEGIRELFDM